MLKSSQRNSAPNRSLNLKSLNTEKSRFLKPESRKMFRPIFPKVPMGKADEDRGVQYACSDYTDLLEQSEIQISMSRHGNPYDKDYASHCTSWVRCDTTSLARCRWDSFTPCAFRGGLAPGCSYRQS